MPLYMDEHHPGRESGRRRPGARGRPSGPGRYGVDYQHYWVDEAGGHVYCLVEAPDEATATQVHQEAHGLTAHRIHEVVQGA